MNKSPWLEELNPERKVHTLESDLETDVVIVGAGIAGMSTAYFTLKHTDKKVTVLEKDLLAHGASGYNAGLLVAEFERSLYDIGRDFGTELAVNAQKEIESGWTLIDEIIAETKLEIPYFKFKGYGGQRTNEEILDEIQNIYFKREHGIDIDNLIVADDTDVSYLPEEYKKYITTVSKAELLERLKTTDGEYVASTENSWAVMNSALFCEKLYEYMHNTYPDRFALFENTDVHKISLNSGHVAITTHKHTVTADKVVLCTNGFENFSITNEGSAKIDFHPTVYGVIGYMTGFTEDKQENSSGYFYTSNADVIGTNDHDDGAEYIEPYLYISERPRSGKMLVCVGGPESSLSESTKYETEMEYPKEKMESLKTMMRDIKNVEIDETRDDVYFWHGLMGYTENGIRIVGEEKRNPRLLYNLGCNGIGILPSIAGGKRTARILGGEHLPPSIFDPK